MIFKIKPVPRLRGKLDLPSSKSYSIRAFIIAACGGDSILIRSSNCDDALVAKNVAESLGAKIKMIRKNTYQIQAEFKGPPFSLGRAKRQPRKFNVKESATVLRFLLPLLSLYAGKSIVVGEGTLRQRPNFHLTQALREIGVNIKGKGEKETVPIRKKSGRLRGGRIDIDGSLSSQFISALLIACPRLEEDTQLNIKGEKIVSQTYITMTLQILRESGIKIQQKSGRLFYIPGNQNYKGLKKFIVPADYGLAAFFLAAGALVKSDLILKGNLKKDFVQSDGKILEFLRQMGVRLIRKDDSIKIFGPFQLKGGNFSLRNCPDLVPIMSIVALFAKGRTRLYDIGHARVKESDRIGDLRNELRKIGAAVSDRADELIIDPQENYREDCLLDPHHDHRLAMAFCILGLKIGVRVKDIGCTRKSYPDFVGDLKKIVRGVT